MITTDDGQNEEVLFEADVVTRAGESSPIVAEGDVRAYFGARFLRADKLTYDPTTDIVIAEGSVSITDENRETAFAGRVELTGDLRNGIAENFSALLAENARLAADTAVREQGARTKLSNAIYTACDVCKKNGEGKTPTWRMKALRVTRDEERRVVRFHHAFFEIKGVPIFYAPFIQAPDPSVERQSGFLTPVIGASSRLGFNLELPYYLAISNSQDATFYPKYTSNDGMLWQGEYRRRDVSGSHVIQAGVINFDNTVPDEDGNLPVDVPGVRWHVFARGHRDFGPHWTAGYDVERVSDDTYLRRYDIRRRGDLRQEIDRSRTNRLRSNTYVNWENGGSQFTANAYLFQGLRASDVSALTPYVLPLLNFRHDFAGEIIGGRSHVNANFAALQRTGGVDSQRLTVSAFWERELITENGHRFDAFAEARVDGYYIHDLHEGTELLPGVPGEQRRTDARFVPTLGLEWSYPLTRRIPGGRLFIEPRVQLLASPSDRNSSDIINEDSQSIEFDYAGLFEYNKAPGFDRFEDGQRFNAGVAASAVFDNGISIEASVGQQYRAQSTSAFDPAVGLGGRRSDIVGDLNVNYKNIIGVQNRFRFDDDDGSLQRAESMAFLNFWRLNANVSYVRLNADPSISFPRREELYGEMRVRLTRHWSTGVGWRENLSEGRTIRQDYVVGYSDECTTLNLIYRRDATRDVGLPPDNAFLIQFTLKSLVD
jgi:LPS-assembly protein